MEVSGAASRNIEYLMSVLQTEDEKLFQSSVCLFVCAWVCVTMEPCVCISYYYVARSDWLCVESVAPLLCSVNTACWLEVLLNPFKIVDLIAAH